MRYSHLVASLGWLLAAGSTVVNGLCNPQNVTYSNESPPNGTYMPWVLMGAINNVPGARQYVTIVNLTPHRFVLQNTHSYQMDVFDWGDVPQGHARQNTVVYTSKAGKNAVDDGGEAYYAIDGTDKTFMIRAATHIPDAHPTRTVIDLTGMGLGQREYLDPANQSPVTLVITGSDSYGFITSIRFGAGNWMKNIYPVIKDRQIQHVVMPGSHDAGMSTISNKLMGGGISENTQTQGINIYNQLWAGSRYFDLRIGSVHSITDNSDYSFWTLHVSGELNEIALGNSGESLDDVISEINQFTAESPGEVIFFRVRYLVGIREVPSLGPIYWTTDMVNDFFGKLRGVNNRCGNLDTTRTFNQKPASYFMDQNGGNGCVIFLLAGDLTSDVPQDSIADGIYKADQLSIADDWSNMGNTQDMAEDQASDWKAVSRGGSSDTFHISQWLVSADFVTTTFFTIESIGILPTNPALYWMGVNNMSPQSWPTVILVDYIGVVVKGQHSWDQLSAELYTLAIGLNLYMISENCDVSTVASPLLPAGRSAMRLSTMAKPWNGIHYANGTIVDDAPRDSHPGRLEILRKGTRFMNGTVIDHDIVNPYYNSTSM
ncbi:PLC-like phosphodiesterase [Trichoderma longibrachiatum ATCC 18648]|uniref:PLC-like phosphodiesterase n=1 Tax=Trichoderma longibrachiatum ATCC 18648 TaxID=983965 RepID=A0A2T4C1C8_TRILO|nr:PLC-like phosphodiesterase [Trichoderma longibrachiatum ATCC 18648]